MMLNQKEVKAKQPSLQPHQGQSPAAAAKMMQMQQQNQQFAPTTAVPADNEPGFGSQTRQGSRQEGVHERRKRNSKQNATNNNNGLENSGGNGNPGGIYGNSDAKDASRNEDTKSSLKPLNQGVALQDDGGLNSSTKKQNNRTDINLANQEGKNDEKLNKGVEESKETYVQQKRTIKLKPEQYLTKAPPKVNKRRSREQLMNSNSEQESSGGEDDDGDEDEADSSEQGSDESNEGEENGQSSSSSFSMSHLKEVTTMEIQMRLEKCPSSTDPNLFADAALDQANDDNQSHADLQQKGQSLHNGTNEINGIAAGASRRSRQQRFRDTLAQRDNPLLSNKGHFKFSFPDAGFTLTGGILIKNGTITDGQHRVASVDQFPHEKISDSILQEQRRHHMTAGNEELAIVGGVDYDASDLVIPSDANDLVGGANSQKIVFHERKTNKLDEDQLMRKKSNLTGCADHGSKSLVVKEGGDDVIFNRMNSQKQKTSSVKNGDKSLQQQQDPEIDSSDIPENNKGLAPNQQPLVLVNRQPSIKAADQRELIEETNNDSQKHNSATDGNPYANGIEDLTKSNLKPRSKKVLQRAASPQGSQSPQQTGSSVQRRKIAAAKKLKADEQLNNPDPLQAADRDGIPSLPIDNSSVQSQPVASQRVQDPLNLQSQLDPSQPSKNNSYLRSFTNKQDIKGDQSSRQEGSKSKLTKDSEKEEQKVPPALGLPQRQGRQDQILSNQESASSSLTPPRALSDNRIPQRDQAVLQNNMPLRRQMLVGAPQNRPKSILKKSIINVQMMHYGGNAFKNQRDLSLPERKNVRFEVRVKIHEFEKYLDNTSDYGQDQADGDSSDGDGNNDQEYENNQRNEEQKNLARKNSISVVSTKKTKEMDLFSPTSVIKHAMQQKISMQPDDPVFRYEFHSLVLKDKELKKKVYSEIKACKSYYSNPKKRVKNFVLDDKTLKNFQRQFVRYPQLTKQLVAVKPPNRRTVIFDLDNTLVKAHYKKHKLESFDACVYMNILNSKKVKLFISYRNFVREMLEQLYSDFELILYSAQPKEYTRDLAKLLTIGVPDSSKKRDNSKSGAGNPGGTSATPASQTVFQHILSKEECIYNEELDRYIVDLEIFTGAAGSENTRDLADIVFITDSYTRVQGKHVRNVIPISSYGGSKKDFSMVALGRYLKLYFNNQPQAPSKSGKLPPPIVKDVRDKIQTDFKTAEYLN